jgi:hypothetical protein
MSRIAVQILQARRIGNQALRNSLAGRRNGRGQVDDVAATQHHIVLLCGQQEGA